MKCPSCGYENKEDARYCNLCQHSFGSFAREPATPYGLAPSLEPKKEAARTASRSQAAGENWFQRHLNWTWALPQLFLYVALLVVGYAIITSMGPTWIMAPSEITSLSPFMSFSILIVVCCLIIPLLMAAAIYGIGVWVLKRKDRSLWWLLIFLIPTAAAFLHGLLAFVALVAVWIVFLRLENRNLLEDVPETPETSSSSIQPGLAPPGLGYRPDKYGP